MDDFLMQQILQNLTDGEIEDVAEGIRQRGDPLRELSEIQFMRLFRVSKELFQFILETLEPFLRPQIRPTDLNISTRILVALRFYAAGSYQRDVGCNWFIGISQSSVSRSLQEVTDAFNRPEILNNFINFFENVGELQNSRRNFYEQFGFPGVIGCIDCTHIAIVPPNLNDEEQPEYLFVNRKNFHSLNVQLICDSSLRITSIDARYPVSTHDAFIWRNSSVNNIMQQINRAGYTDFYLLGDSGYPLRPWLLTPLEEEPPPNTPAHRYNVAHKTVRSLIERCNGLLKARFRCCLKHRVLHYAPAVAGKIINACAILHNMCIEYNIPEPEEVDLEDEPGNDLFVDGDGGERQEVRGNPDLAAGRNKRAILIATRF